MIGEIIGTNSMSFILVFLEGILSFFSPCIIPVYMGCLAGSGKKVDEECSCHGKRSGGIKKMR